MRIVLRSALATCARCAFTPGMRCHRQGAPCVLLPCTRQKEPAKPREVRHTISPASANDQNAQWLRVNRADRFELAKKPAQGHKHYGAAPGRGFRTIATPAGPNVILRFVTLPVSNSNPPSGTSISRCSSE